MPDCMRNCIQIGRARITVAAARRKKGGIWRSRGALYWPIVPRKKVSKPRVPSAKGRPASGASERANRLYDSLRNMIVRGQLAPGARIVETEVAERFGVSRTPVRAAFQRLEQEGYVTASPTHQARMTGAPLTREDVGELLEIVGELEGLAARSAARLTDPERERLAKELTTLNADFRPSAAKSARRCSRTFRSRPARRPSCSCSTSSKCSRRADAAAWSSRIHSYPPLTN